MKKLVEKRALLLSLFLMVILSLSAIYFFTPRFPQPQDYHSFADRGTFWGIAYPRDVLSSLVFVPLGIWGYLVARSLKKREESLLWKVMFSAVVLIGLGSFYYHLDPTNPRLVVDRLPIAIVLMTFLSILIVEKIDAKWGMRLFPFLCGLGMFSVLWWIHGETKGMGDLRLYVWVHIFPMLIIPFLAFAAPTTPKQTLLLLLAWTFNALSKVFEVYDKEIFQLLQATLSGHTLKHLSAAVSVYLLIVYCRLRR